MAVVAVAAGIAVLPLRQRYSHLLSATLYADPQEKRGRSPHCSCPNHRIWSVEVVAVDGVYDQPQKHTTEGERRTEMQCYAAVIQTW